MRVHGNIRKTGIKKSTNYVDGRLASVKIDGTKNHNGLFF